MKPYVFNLLEIMDSHNAHVIDERTVVNEVTDKVNTYTRNGMPEGFPRQLLLAEIEAVGRKLKTWNADAIASVLAHRLNALRTYVAYDESPAVDETGG